MGFNSGFKGLNKQYIEQPKNFVTVRAVPRLCVLHPGICLTTEEKARKNLSQGSRRMSFGTMKTEYTEQSIHNNKNTEGNMFDILHIFLGGTRWRGWLRRCAGSIPSGVIGIFH